MLLLLRVLSQSALFNWNYCILVLGVQNIHHERDKPDSYFSRSSSRKSENFQTFSIVLHAAAAAAAAEV